MRLPGLCQGKYCRTRGAEVRCVMPNSDKPELNIDDWRLKIYCIASLCFFKIDRIPYFDIHYSLFDIRYLSASGGFAFLEFLFRFDLPCFAGGGAEHWHLRISMRVVTSTKKCRYDLVKGLTPLVQQISVYFDVTLLDWLQNIADLSMYDKK